MRKKLEIENNLNALFEEFITRMELQIVKAETIQNPTLKMVRQTQFDKSEVHEISR